MQTLAVLYTQNMTIQYQFFEAFNCFVMKEQQGIL